MSDVSIKVHKTIETDSTYVPSFTLKLKVTGAVGVTPCIFVHEFQPKSTVEPAKYEFMNIAYYDELAEVSDVLKSRKRSQLVRKDSIDKRFVDKESLDEFLFIVYKDIQRLIHQVETTATDGLCEDIVFTADKVEQVSVSCPGHENTQESEALTKKTTEDTVILSFDGK